MSDTPDEPPTTTAATRPPRKKAHFGRRALVWTIVIVASVLGVISILSSWANQQALDTDNWRQTSEEIIQNPKVAPALSAFVVDQLYSNVDLAGELGAQLPPLLKPLAGPAVSALREPATKNVQKLLARPRFQERFVNASELAHEKYPSERQCRRLRAHITGHCIPAERVRLARHDRQRLGMDGRLVFAKASGGCSEGLLHSGEPTRRP